MTFSRVLQFAFSQVWAMEEGFHRKMFQVLLRHAEGVKLSDEEITAATGTEMRKRSVEMRIEKGVAVIPIHGVIAHRASAVGRLSSNVGTSVEHIRQDLETAMADDSVQAVVLDVDSPGGSVSGIDELATEIRAARDRKPIVASTDGLMASAAYYLASQADRVIATKSSMVGSIGVIASFLDDYRYLAGKGIDPVVVKSVPGKGGVQTNGSFSDSDRADLQREVDAYHAMFVDAVAAGRRMTGEDAKAIADGRTYTGAEALSRRLIDAVESNPAKAITMARSLARVRSAAATTSKPAANVAAGALPSEEPMTTETETSAATNKLAAAVPTPPPEQPTPAAQATPTPTPAPHDPVAAERQRCTAIHAAADASQHALVAQLVRDNVPVGDAITAIMKDRASKQQLPNGAATASQAAGNSTGNKSNEDEAIKAMPEGEAKWKKEWAASAELRDEFLNDEGAFLAFKRAESRGQTRLDKASA